MVIISASQAEDGGSIPLTRSNKNKTLAEIAQLVEQRTRNA